MWMALLRWLAPYLMKGAAIAGVLFALWLYIGHVERAARDDQKRLDGGAIREAQWQARFNASEAARAKEAGAALRTKESNHAMLPALDAANASLARYLAWLRAPADQGGAGQADLPRLAYSPDVVDGADRLSVLDEDLRRCTAIAVRLHNAQDWWAKEAGAAR